MSSNAYFCNENKTIKENSINLREKIMRKTQEEQMTFGNVDISQIKTDYKSRDEIDKTVLNLIDDSKNNEDLSKYFQKKHKTY